MRKGQYAIFAALLFPALFILIAGPARAESAGLSIEAKTCLSCHAQHGYMVTFGNNEFVEAYVDAGKFNASVHNSLSCSQCHPDFSADKHPRRTFRSKSHYQTKAALVCRKCHTDRQIKKSSIHTTLLNEEKTGTATICTNCHGSHAIERITKTGQYSNEEAYCMKCHGYPVKMAFRNGETLSGTMNLSTLQASVHNKVSCSDCHYGFSSEEHPERNFATRRDYTLASSENCRRCHFDKYTKTMESIHYTMLSQGNLDAPVCIDCHGSHGISHISKERVLIAKRCQRCHAAIYDIYAKSVHGNALFNEHNQDVPVCADCHTAHTIKDPRTLDYRERVPEMCSNCHANEAVVGKYGLSIAVADSYLSDFHGVTLKFYKLQKITLNKPARPMAVCTDCHGTHNINSTVGPNATIVKANLVKTCQKCHAKASTNFPESWISHYKPSLTRAPLVFFIIMAYKIFIPVLVAGLVLQILLHIWRYVVDR
jgi:predicted CXXCH cytochrome family protein